MPTYFFSHWNSFPPPQLFPKRHFATKPLICFVSLFPIRVFYGRPCWIAPSPSTVIAQGFFFSFFFYCCICERDSSITEPAFSTNCALCPSVPPFKILCAHLQAISTSNSLRGHYNDKVVNCAEGGLFSLSCILHLSFVPVISTI